MFHKGSATQALVSCELIRGSNSRMFESILQLKVPIVSQSAVTLRPIVTVSIRWRLHRPAATAGITNDQSKYCVSEPGGFVRTANK
jgi:hypothetical protein